MSLCEYARKLSISGGQGFVDVTANENAFQQFQQSVVVRKMQSEMP